MFEIENGELQRFRAEKCLTEVCVPDGVSGLLTADNIDIWIETAIRCEAREIQLMLMNHKAEQLGFRELMQDLQL